jgi:hypothetical protein
LDCLADKRSEQSRKIKTLPSKTGLAKIDQSADLLTFEKPVASPSIPMPPTTLAGVIALDSLSKLLKWSYPFHTSRFDPIEDPL